MSKDQKMLILTILLGVLAVPFLLFAKNAPPKNISDTISLEATPAPTNIMTEVTELLIEDLVVGTGAEAKSGNLITVNYAGMLLDGTKFDSSYERGAPFKFTLGTGEVIAGWDQGFAGMKVGGKRKLTIPSHLGYGAQGAGSDIPPNSTLVFEVELLEVK